MTKSLVHGLAAATPLLVGPIAAEAEPAVYRIGFVHPESTTAVFLVLDAFRQELRESGYVGKDDRATTSP